MKSDIYPLLFEPVYKNYIWGGRKIQEIFQRTTNLDICSESWEISDHDNGMSIVKNGPLQGKTLREITASMQYQLTGKAAPDGRFPLLIKLIDAQERLSVQVHPDNNTAPLYGGDAKTEAWYLLECESQSRVFAGLKNGVTREDFVRALETSSVESLLADIQVTPEDTIYIPGGCVHSIAEGCLLLEIQQNSDTTYRVYDWNRVDQNGKPRKLHTQQALDTIDWKCKPPTAHKPHSPMISGKNTHWQIIQSPYFQIVKIDLNEAETFNNDGLSFHALFVVKGNMVINEGSASVQISAGTSCLIPAALHEYKISPLTQETVLLRISLS